MKRLKKLGRKYGIRFKHGGYVGNTFESHRLIDYARKNGGKTEEERDKMQNRVVEYIFM